MGGTSVEADTNNTSTPAPEAPAEEDVLGFESRFECGNLARAAFISGHFYELYLRPDLYTSRHTQWYYFAVTNMKLHTLYRYNQCYFKIHK